MSKMTDRMKALMLASLEQSMAQVFAGGLQVVVERISGKSVVLRLFVTDDKGLPIIEIGHEAARLNAALQAQISDVRREVARMGLTIEDDKT